MLCLGNLTQYIEEKDCNFIFVAVIVRLLSWDVVQLQLGNFRYFFLKKFARSGREKVRSLDNENSQFCL